MLQPRKLILHSLMVDPKLRQRPTEFFGLRLHPRHFADQVANDADQIGMRSSVPTNQAAAKSFIA